MSQRDISRYCDQARQALLKDFVPAYFGAGQMSREQWLGHNSKLAEELFCSEENNETEKEENNDKKKEKKKGIAIF